MNKQKLLSDLKEKEKSDLELPLRDSAINLVFGEGNPDAKVLFLGEAPGRFEDERGLPFVGAAGKVLDELLGGINLKREDVFITSVLHYRPPKNRQPKPIEIKAFEKYVNEIIKIINPRVIATLGNFSLNKFLPGEKISQIHGKPQNIKFYDLKLIILPLYHPAAVLYSRKLKETLIEDFKTIQQLLKN